MDQSSYMPVTPVLPGDMEGLRLVGIDAKRVTHPLFVIVKPRKRDSDQGGNFVAKAAGLIVDAWRFGGVSFVELYDEPDATDKDWWAFEHFDDNLEHSQWLSMMYPRLVLLRELLAEEGSIWVFIDDNEGHYLKVLMDEVFGRKNFIANIIWQKKYSLQNDAEFFSAMHDHIHVFAKNSSVWKRNLAPRTDKQDRAYKNLDNDPRGIWKASDLTRAEHRDRDFYGITTPSGKLVIDGAGQVEASQRFPFRFEPNRYPVRTAYRGRWVFKKHYYPQIAELKGEGEEFDCAVTIDAHPRVKHWVRNLVGLPQFAFWLPSSTDYFYPDFVCELNDGRLLVVEYKGEHLVAGELEKRQVGEVWARSSSGKCLFLMAVKKDEAGRDVRAQLDAVIGRS